MPDTQPDSIVRYELTLTIERAVRYDLEAPLAEQEAWRVSTEAKREVEREVMLCLRRLDGDCSCEVLEAVIVAEA